MTENKKCPISFNSIANAINGNGGAPTQTIRIEQAPLKIIAVDPNNKDNKKTYEL